MPQTGPGQYEMTTAAPRAPVLAIVTVDGQVAARIPVAGRYAPEFDAVGNDRQAMDDVASATGGRVVLPGETGRIDLGLPQRQVELTAWLALCGVLAVLYGLITWKRGFSA
jgi:hypothetical protein